VTSQIVITEYAYNDSGLRVTETTTTDGGTPVVKSFLFDPSNPTGYAQVLEEYIDGALSKTFTLGHDVISQHDSANGVLTLLTDGHGSTRALLNTLGVIIEQYAYEAYGNMLEGTNLTTAQAALTSLLYSGEWTQANGQQYLRARFYDPTTGTFNRLDPFSGNNSDPQSLHKYLYTHGNPVMGVDPSGLFTLNEILATVSISTITGCLAGGATFSALGQSPLEGILVGGQLGFGLSVAFIRGGPIGVLKAVAMGVISATLELIINGIEIIGNAGSVIRGDYNFDASRLTADLLRSFSEAVFDTALSGSNSLTVAVGQSTLIFLRSTVSDGLRAYPGGDISEETITGSIYSAGIEAVIALATSRAGGYPDWATKRLSKLIDKKIFNRLILGGSNADSAQLAELWARTIVPVFTAITQASSQSGASSFAESQ